ncbi:MAG: hypothetical protein AABY22_19900, partial [Nanoarchaeota archaeon]
FTPSSVFFRVLVMKTMEEKIFDTEAEAREWALKYTRIFNKITNFTLYKVKTGEVLFELNPDKSGDFISR